LEKGSLLIFSELLKWRKKASYGTYTTATTGQTGQPNREKKKGKGKGGSEPLEWLLISAN